MKKFFPVYLAFIAAFSSLALPAASAYTFLSSSWPLGAKVQMHLGLGASQTPLQDGFSSYNAVAADAISIWDGYLDFLRFESTTAAGVPQQEGDRVNSVFFASSAMGEAFDDNTIAVTLVHNNGYNTTEADVIVNNAFRFNAYAGPQQSDSRGPVIDLHRVLLHEFGHVLGLDHNDRSPRHQRIMESVISDMDHLAADDIAGVQFIYGGDAYFYDEDHTTRPGEYAGYSFYKGFFTSFTASGLPPGMSYNAQHGLIEGTPTKPGLYGVVLKGHCHFGDACFATQINVLDFASVPGLLKIINAAEPLADPVRPYIYFTDGGNAVDAIDTRTLATSTLWVGGNGQLSLSADYSKLLSTSPSQPHSTERRFDLNTRQVLSPLPIPAGESEILEGLTNVAFVVGTDGIHQFDANTGAQQQTFDAPSSQSSRTYYRIALSPDRRTLYSARSGNESAFSSYDVSGPSPILRGTSSDRVQDMAFSPDGHYNYFLTFAPTPSLYRAVVPAVRPATRLRSDADLNSVSVAPNGKIYQSVAAHSINVRGPSGFISVIDPLSLRSLYEISLNPLQQGVPESPAKIIFDHTGKYFFLNVEPFGLWIFSTEQAAAPPPAAPTKNLVDISTRCYARTGENEMIGGFIVSGSAPKKILIRGLGPSLPLTGAMADPVLELYDSSHRLIDSNDNWITRRIAILGTTLAPSSPREAALLVTLPPGAYTAIVHDRRDQPGLALLEVYDLDPKSSLLANISTRGKVESGDNVMIGGIIVGGKDPTKVLVRAIGPSLAQAGVAGALADPVLELHDKTGKTIATNDDWRSGANASQIASTHIAPNNAHESAILATLSPGNYTAIVRGKNGTTGVALVEAYNLEGSAP